MEYWGAYTNYYTPPPTDAWLGASSGAAHWRTGHLPDSPSREVYSVAEHSSARVWSVEEHEVSCNLPSIIALILVVTASEMGPN